MTTPRILLPFSEWPAADRLLWEQRFSSMDIFDRINPATVRADMSRYSVTAGYRRWLGYLVRRNALVEGSAPAERVTPMAVSEYVDHLREHVAPPTVYTYVRYLHRAIKAMTPGIDWEWLLNVERGLVREKRSVRSTKPLVPIERLYDLGFKLMEQAERSRPSYPLNQALLHHDGLMIALQSARPLRRSNLVHIRIGLHLVRSRTRWSLRIPRGETKNRRLYDVLLPEAMNAPIDRFLKAYRPRFKGAHSDDHLWLSCRGGPLGPEGLCRAIASRTGKALGVRLYPNTFRACAATSIAKDDPANIGTASRLLGHTSLLTTEWHYNRAETIDASRRYLEHLEALRSRLGCG